MASGVVDLPFSDVSGLKRVGCGVSAEVFAIDRDRALKLMFAGQPEDAMAREAAATRVAHAAGLPVPALLGQTVIDGRHALVLTRFVEASWLRRARRWPGAVMVTLGEMAHQHAALHRVVVPPALLPSAHEVLAARIDGSSASPRVIAAARAALARAPRGDRLAHGDLHLGNIMTTRCGMKLIDWAQAMRGDPAADVARSELVMRFGRFGPLLQRHRWPRVARDAAAAWYVLCYRAMTGMSDAAIDAWRLPVAVAWLREGSAAHLPALEAYVERRLAGVAATAPRGRLVTR